MMRTHSRPFADWIACTWYAAHKFAGLAPKVMLLVFFKVLGMQNLVNRLSLRISAMELVK